jgi:L-ascorbate metabolism protein UlaG (beta-lactamase superfamily)
MHITWHGLSCIKLQTQDALLLINPYQDSVGISMPKLKVDILLSSNMADDQCNNLDRLQGEPFLITTPGEYEVKNMFVYGTPDEARGTLFMVEAEGIKVGHLGTSPLPLTSEQLELFEGVDVLFLPLSGGEEKQRAELVSQIEPRVIIPIQYTTPKVTVALETVNAFAKEMGVSDTTGEKKIIVKEKDLPVEETRVMVLQAI